MTSLGESFSAVATTIIGLTLLTFPARAWMKSGDLLTSPVLRSERNTINDSLGPTARVALRRAHLKSFPGDPELLVPVFALRGRMRWCSEPGAFVFCDHWTSGDALPSQHSSHSPDQRGRPSLAGLDRWSLRTQIIGDRASGPLHPEPRLEWRMCSCGVR